jgi:hypothetical protein
MSYCGIPRHLPGGAPLPMDAEGSRRLAARAVKDVYQFCSSYDEATVGDYLRFMSQTRRAIGAQFRTEHGSSDVAAEGEKANVFPYFIGAFDTVAALGHRGLSLVVVVAVLASPFILSFIISLLSYMPHFPFVGAFFVGLTYWKVFFAVARILIAAASLLGLKNYLKWAPALPGYGVFKRLKTIHFARTKHQFYDLTLNVNVGYAKHAISIDENRADFARVGWAPNAEKQGTRDLQGNLYFEQVWFPGVHADVGGGYQENESRLSDISLGWMLATASMISNGLKHDDSVLHLHPDPAGPQHNEQKGSWLAFGLRKLPGTQAVMHKSVYGRFAAGPVVLFDRADRYCPQNMREHVDFVQYFDPNVHDPQRADPAQAVAADIESVWERQREADAPTNPEIVPVP